MNTSSDDQRFLELLQRWQSGDFNRQDEQALRSLTDSDDFRREAMEGFMALPETDHSTRLAALRERLRVAAPPRNRIISMPQMMAIAAALLVLVVAILFLPRIAEKQNEPIAQTSETAAPSPTTPPSIQEDESQPSDVMADRATIGKQAKERPSATQSPERQAPYTDQAPAGANKDVAVEESVTSAPANAPATMAVRPPTVDDVFPGGPAGNVEKTKMVNKPVLTQAKKKSTETADSLVWNDTDKKSDLEPLRKEVQADKLGPAQSEPENGWPAFAEYLRQNARLPLEARDRNVSGTVRLQFTVNENGDPQNFIILRSLGQSCDDEAKRLVQNWNWVRGQNPVVTVEVKFVR